MKQSLGCITLLLLLTLVGCNSNGDVVINQQEEIETMLTNAKLTYDQQGGVYRHVANADRDGYTGAAQIEKGDFVSFDFAGYTFIEFTTSQTPQPFYTNKKDLVVDVVKDKEGNESEVVKYKNLNIEHWSFETVVAEIGKTQLIKGLKEGLQGCRGGDSLALFITSDLAFGNKDMGSVTKNQSLVYVVNVRSVNK